MVNPSENLIFKEQTKPISENDASRINNLGNISNDIEELNHYLENPDALSSVDEKYIDGVRQRQDALKQDENSLYSFSIGKIKNIPNSKVILGLVQGADVSIIDKYDKQTNELLQNNVPVTLMTAEEKQQYYDAQSRRDGFVTYLRDNFGINQEVGKKLYEEIARRQEIKLSNNQQAGVESDGLRMQREDQKKIDEEKIEEVRNRLGIPMGENKTESEMPIVIDRNSNIKSFEKGTSIDNVVTANGSVYKYLPDGRTQRFKKAEGKNYEPQDATVFVPNWEWIEKNMPKQYRERNILGENSVDYDQILLEFVQNNSQGGDRNKKVYIVDDKDRRLETNEEIIKAGKNIFLSFGEKNNAGGYKEQFKIPITARPAIGYLTFDQRRYKEGNQWMRERHLGNEVVEITRKNNKNETKSYVEENLKDFENVEVKKMSELPYWEKINKFLGDKGITESEVIIIGDEEKWKSIYGSNDSKSSSKPKAIILKKEIFDQENISDENMSWLIHEIGHIEFYKSLGEKLDEYMEEYHKKGEYTSSEMEKEAFKIQFEFLKSIGKTKEECLDFIKKYLDDSFKKEEETEKEKELTQIGKYLSEVF